MRIRTPAAAAEPGLDMTPMIDTVFNLLIFFLVATTFQQAEREVQIALPFASSAAPITAQLREIVVNVRADGGLVVNGRELAPEALAGIIRDAVAANPQQKVTVRGDRNASYQHVVNALDICKQNGVQQPYLDTVATP
jgi:biopolymer transport protein ExbD